MLAVTERLFAVASRTCAIIVGAVPAVAVVALVWASIRPALLGVVPTGLEELWSVALFTVGVAATAAAAGGALGIGSAIAAEELAPGAARASIEAAIGFIGAVPAVAFGWFAVALVVPLVARFTSGTTAYFFDASIVLTAMVAPTACTLVTRALRRMPDNVRQAAAASGATRLQATSMVVIPALRRQISAAVLTAFAQAATEATALQILFVVVAGRSSGTPSTVASWIFGSVTSNPAAAGSLALLALSLVALAALCAAFVEREYRAMQWA
jgi:ABC-type phosphate transport system permease subunit